MTAGPYGALLDAVRGVRWPAARRVMGATLGAHPSNLRGNSSEFSEFRPYRQGDDPRRLDWRLLARSDRAYVRLTTDRATLRTSLIVDASASMAFPLPSLDKWRLARDLAIGLASVVHGEADPVGLTIARERPLELAPRARRSVLVQMIGALDATTPDGSSALAPLVDGARASRLVVITDLLGDADALLASARLRMATGAEVHVVHIVATEELDPPLTAVMAVDPERTSVRRTLDASTRAGYERAYASWLDETAAALAHAGVRYIRALTSEPATKLIRHIVGDTGRAGA
jgi:uncharacterized protein (DUF58 family)